MSCSQHSEAIDRSGNTAAMSPLPENERDDRVSWQELMPLYQFHQTNGTVLDDDDMTSCETFEQAKTLALEVAEELGRNRRPGHIAGKYVSVTDSSGNEVFRTPLVNRLVERI